MPDIKEALERLRPTLGPRADTLWALYLSSDREGREELEQLRLHSEARQETVSCWRDTVLLAKELAELVQKAGEATQRERLLDGDGL